MVESMYKYFDSDLSESHRVKLYISTLLDPRFKNYNMWPTRKYVWTKTFKSSAAAEDDVQEDDVDMTVEGGASSAGHPADEDPSEL